MNAIKGLVGAGALALALAAGSAEAQELKIGIMTVLSGPQAVLGGQLRDGFNLAVKHGGGSSAGSHHVTVQDDELKPDVAVGKAKQLIERDKVDFVVGPVFSNILMAIQKPITEANVFLISPNAGPSPLAGKGCSPTSSPPPTRMTSRRRFSASTRRTRDSRRPSCWHPTIRPAKT